MEGNRAKADPARLAPRRGETVDGERPQPTCRPPGQRDAQLRLRSVGEPDAHRDSFPGLGYKHRLSAYLSHRAGSVGVRSYGATAPTSGPFGVEPPTFIHLRSKRLRLKA